MKKFFCNLFLNYSESTTIFPGENLEDICFFRGGKLLLGTVSHEGICRVYPPPEGFEKELRAIYSGWQYFAQDEDPVQLRYF